MSDEAEVPMAAAPPVLYREVGFAVDLEAMAARAASRAAGDGGDDDTIPVCLSSETAVFRSEWWTGEEYNEVLDHAPSSVDLSYARDGLPFMMSHRSSDGDSQHGILENVRVSPDKKIRADLRMSNAVRSKEIGDDIRRGIRKKVSIGYVRGDVYDQSQPGGANSIPTRTYRGWMPVEGSVVPVPADYKVGFGRSADGAALPPELTAAIARFLSEHRAPATAPRKAKESRMTEEETRAAAAAAAAAAAPAAAAAVAVAERAGQDESQRVADISTIAEQHGMLDKLPSWIREKKSLREVTLQASEEIKARMKRGPVAHAPLDLGGEKRVFNFARALMAGDERLADELRAETGAARIDVGFEREVMVEIRKAMPDSPRAGAGAVLPLALAGSAQHGARAGIDSGTTSTGGPFKFTQPGDFIEILRNRLALTRLGATFLSGLTGPVSFPKQNGTATGFWMGENSGSDVTDSNLTNSTISLAFKTLMASTSVSRQALFSAASGNYDLDAIIRNDMARVIALAADLGGLLGPGTANQPLGIFLNTAAGTYTLGANGGSMAWADWVNIETQAAVANADTLSGLGYCTNPTQRGVAKKVGVLGNTASGIPIWGGNAEMGQVNNYPAIATNQIPKNLTKGTSTTVCSGIIFGPWSAQMIGQFGNGFEVLTDPYRLKKQGMIELTAYMFLDAANRYPEGFVNVKDAL